jgi:hypothetical protein
MEDDEEQELAHEEFYFESPTPDSIEARVEQSGLAERVMVARLVALIAV